MSRRAGVRTRSLRARVLLALGATLTVATVISLLVDVRVTGSRLDDEGARLLEDNLRIAAQFLTDQRAQRVTAMRFEVSRLQTSGVDTATDAAELQQLAGVNQRNLGVSGVLFALEDGTVLAGAGTQPASGSVGPLDVTQTGVAREVIGRDGAVLEVVGVPIGGTLWMAYTLPLDDARAFELRRIIGQDVAFLHGGEVTGTTVEGVDALRTAQTLLGNSARVTTTIGGPDGTPALVGLTPVADETVLAVIAPPVLQGLGRDLAQARAAVFLLLLVVALALGYWFVQRLTRPLNDLAATAEAVGRGEDRPFGQDGVGEIGQLAATLERMRQELLAQVEIISDQAAELRGATRRIVGARDVERRRLARDLHDGVQQQLVMLRLQVSLAGEELEEGERTAIGEAIDAAIGAVRDTSHAIYPAILGDRGLTGALYSLARGAAVTLDLLLDPDPLPRLPETMETGLYFSAAEAVTNAVKHADADRVEVSLRVDDQHASLTVRDDGVGFDAATPPTGVGLQSIRDRAAALGGTAALRSRPGRGTAVAVVVPLVDSGPTGPLEVEQHGGDAPVEVVRVPQAKLLEDRAGVLLDRALADDKRVSDG